MSTAVIAIHGGAGAVSATMKQAAHAAPYHTALSAALEAGRHVLARGGSALDAVTEAVVVMEDCPLFNAGHGAVLTASKTHELDAAVMNGKTLEAGAVAGVSRLRNPVRAARLLMEKSGPVLMIGAGAEGYLSSLGMALVDPGYFTTEEKVEQLRRTLKAGAPPGLDHDEEPVPPLDPKGKLGTVGAVALDEAGNLAAATSTGGLTGKRPGRVGDSPIIGAGCYADQEVAVSATGIGEVFIRCVVGHDISALVSYAGLDLDTAAGRIVHDKLMRYGGRGGVIAVDRFGNLALPFNTEGMYRGFARVGGELETAI